MIIALHVTLAKIVKEMFFHLHPFIPFDPSLHGPAQQHMIPALILIQQALPLLVLFTELTLIIAFAFVDLCKIIIPTHLTQKLTGWSEWR